MKYPIIKQLSGKFPVRRLCKMLEVSHGGYYEWRGRGPSPRAREDRRLRVQIRAAFGESRDRYGSPRIHKQLRQREIRCCRKRVARLMRQEGLRARQPRRFRVTTRPTPGRSAAPNVLARRFTVDAVDSVWVGDLTYLWTQEGWLYLAVLMDLCSRRIIGWAVGPKVSVQRRDCAFGVDENAATTSLSVGVRDNLEEVLVLWGGVAFVLGVENANGSAGSGIPDHQIDLKRDSSRFIDYDCFLRRDLVRRGQVRVEPFRDE